MLEEAREWGQLIFKQSLADVTTPQQAIDKIFLIEAMSVHLIAMVAFQHKMNSGLDVDGFLSEVKELTRTEFHVLVEKFKDYRAKGKVSHHVVTDTDHVTVGDILKEETIPCMKPSDVIH